jgi:tetratricopeptide (TPR) repeat protein
MRSTPGSAGGVAGALQRALADHRAGRLRRAHQAYLAILRQAPGHPDARYLAGVSASQQGALGEAVDHFRVCLGARPDHMEAQLGLANALQGLGRTTEAIPCYEAVLEKHPDHVAALNNLAVARLSLGDAEAAGDACIRAITAAPDYVPARNNLGVARLGLHDYAGAETAFRRALCLKPGDGDAMKGLGDARHAGTDAAGAARAFGCALAIRPGHPSLLYALGMARRDIGDHAGALTTWRETLLKQPAHDRAHAQIALLHLASGDIAAADQAVFEQVRALRAPDAQLDQDAETFRLTGATKLRHDAEQWRHLIARDHLPERFAGLADEAETIADTLKGEEVTDLARRRPPVSPEFRSAFNRLHFLAPAPEIAGGALNPALPVAEIQRAYAEDGLLAARIDDLLKPEAHAALLRFCRESTIWFQTKFAREVGGRFAEGLCCPLILQIAADLQRALPGILDGLMLRTVFGYMYYQDGEGGHLHADQGLVGYRRVVTLNYWLTPDEANAEAERGGLWICDKQAPAAYFHATDDARRAQVLESLVADPATRWDYVPYAGNRAMLFRADVLHKSDRIRFKPGLENRRISLTFNFGALG